MSTPGLGVVSLPSGVLIELTSRCNLTCRMCPLTAGDTPSSRDPGNIDPVVWQRVSAFASRVGRANVGGYGEPLSNQKCLGYLRELDAAGVRISLTTNATMVNEKIAAELAALRNLVNINVSLDSPDALVYKDIRGGELEHATRGVRLLARVMGPQRLTVSAVLMRSNLESLKSSPARLREFGVGSLVLQGLVDYTAGLEDEFVGWENGLSDAVDAIREAAKASDVRLVLELPHRSTTSAPHLDAAPASSTDTRQCFAPWDEPVVDKDGRVFPCCYAMTHGRSVLGDLKEETFEAVWHGRAYADFRRAIVDGRTTPDICRQCTVVPSGPHLYREYSAALVPEASRLTGVGPFRVVMRNTGVATWTRADQVHVGTSAPRDRASALRHPLWLGANRVSTFTETEVPAGGLATFEIPVMPLHERAAECFQLVVEHRGWLPGTGFTLLAEAKGMSDQTTPLSPVRQLLKRLFGVFGAVVALCAITSVAEARQAKARMNDAARKAIATAQTQQLTKTMDRTIDAHVERTKRVIEPATRDLIKADLQKNIEGLSRSGLPTDVIEQRNLVFLRAVDARITGAGPITPAIYQMQRNLLFTEPVAVSIESVPTGALVAVDGADIGTSNIKQSLLPGKDYSFRFSLAGFDTVSRKVYISPAGAQSVIEELAPVTPGSQTEKQAEETGGSFPIFLVSFAILGVASFVIILVRMGRWRGR